MTHTKEETDLISEITPIRGIQDSEFHQASKESDFSDTQKLESALASRLNP
jgi:hypothetical protein